MCGAKKFGIIGIVVGSVVGIASVCQTIYLNRKINRIGDVIGLSIDQISNDIPVDVPKAIIDRAIETAVNHEVKQSVKNITEEIIFMMRRDMHSRVTFAIKEESANMQRSVSEEVTKQVANIDISRLKQDVRERAKDIILEKFDDNLESMLEDFNKNLSNMKKIYGSIAEAMEPKKSSETVLRIGG